MSIVEWTSRKRSVPGFAVLLCATAAGAVLGAASLEAAPAHQEGAQRPHKQSPGENPSKSAKPQDKPMPATGALTPKAMFAPPPGEVKNFGAWTVTCLPQAKAGAPRACMAKMEIIKSKDDQRPILIANMIRSGGATTFVLQTPTGVDLGPGVSVKLGDAAMRKLNYVSCEPALCTSAVLLDDALAQELVSAAKVSVTWMGLGVGEVRVEFEAKESKDAIAFLAAQ